MANVIPPCNYCGKRHLSQDCPDLPAQARGIPLPGGRYGVDLQYDPPQPPPLPAWTKLGEDELRKARARVAELEARRAAAISEVTRVADVVYGSGMTRDEFVAYMIEHADDIRDALQPFDSGVREA